MKNLLPHLVATAFLFVISACSSSGGSDEPIDTSTFSIDLSATSFDFGDVATDGTGTENFTISNTGTGSISITGMTSSSNFTVNPSTSTIAAGTSKSFSITFSPDAQKAFSQTIAVSSNATNGSKTIALTGYGVEPFYENIIAPIVANNCSTTGCHSTASKSGGIAMTTFLESKNAFVTDKAWDEIQSGRMPKGGSLTTTQKDELLKWIESNYTDGIVPVSASYQTDIAPIINQSCATTACHDSNSPKAGLDLSTYAFVKTAFTATGTSSAIGRIESGNMPQGGSKLSQTKIDLIKSWIAGGFSEQ
ncbi:choice-of-anchor D domain-containing protein [Flavicella sediminum]|uniref:choice-of-anchor D domain-containing protein n=1 Tax=Flavicella sediminum TaxID=2585141 RepID=UPI00111CB6FA|nr:choice-of-anchor D domain-containing protein [Flavicella sediminum]